MAKKKLPTDDEMLGTKQEVMAEMEAEEQVEAAPEPPLEFEGAKKTRGETKTWVMILDKTESHVELKAFDHNTALRTFLKENPECEVLGDFAVRGYVKPFQVTQQVRF